MLNIRQISKDRLRFRVWDDIHRTMEKLEDSDVNPFNISDYPQNNIMQCTGLKDKNGKLMYEKDVLKDDNGALFQIKWCYNSYELKPLFKGGYTLGLIDEEFEVVGNIYENKELLNEMDC